MNVSSSRFKALTVSAGFTFWFFIISSILGIFTIEALGIFILIIFPLMQFFSLKVSKALDVFAVYNTKIFLGIIFVFVISIYGILFRVLQIDLFRLKKHEASYWIKMDELKLSRIFKQY